MADADTVSESALPELLARSRTGLSNIGSLFDGPPNLSMTVRAAYIVGGLGLAAAGARPRPNRLLNLLALAGGAYLAWSGYKGRCPMKAAVLDHEPSRGTDARIAG